MKSVVFLSVFVLLFFSAIPDISSQEAIYLIRHAEQDISAGSDPPLTAEGIERAEKWSYILGDADISKVIVSEYERSRETGEIIANLLGVSTQTVGKYKIRELRHLLNNDFTQKSVVVVSHSGVIPQILREYGLSEYVTISKSFYDYLFIILPITESSSKIVRLRCK